MFITTTLFSDKFVKLRGTIQKASSFARAHALALELHAMTHPAQVSGSSTSMYEDTLLAGLTDKDFAAAPTEKSFPVAWHLWHITRIEDLVGNILINNAPQIFDPVWAKKINAPATDTGNAMDAKQARIFSEQIVVSELKKYRIAVGCQTQKTIASLRQPDMRKKPCLQSLDRLLVEGASLNMKSHFGFVTFGEKRLLAGLSCCR